LPALDIFHKRKKQEEPKTDPNPTNPNPAPQTPTENPTPQPPTGNTETAAKTYLKAMPLKDLTDLENIKTEVNNGNILILRITPLANKSIEDVKYAVNELYDFTETIHGDIARLGEERIVICPPKIRIWREKPAAQNEPLPTAA
jgi:uncharacterized protein